MKPHNLSKLLSALQASLLFWCQNNLRPREKESDGDSDGGGGGNKEAVSGLVTKCE